MEEGKHISSIYPKVPFQVKTLINPSVILILEGFTKFKVRILSPLLVTLNLFTQITIVGEAKIYIDQTILTSGWKLQLRHV